MFSPFLPRYSCFFPPYRAPCAPALQPTIVFPRPFLLSYLFSPPPTFSHPPVAIPLHLIFPSLPFTPSPGLLFCSLPSRSSFDAPSKKPSPPPPHTVSHPTSFPLLSLLPNFPTLSFYFCDLPRLLGHPLTFIINPYFSFPYVPLWFLAPFPSYAMIAPFSLLHLTTTTTAYIPL